MDLALFLVIAAVACAMASWLLFRNQTLKSEQAEATGRQTKDGPT